VEALEQNMDFKVKIRDNKSFLMTVRKNAADKKAHQESGDYHNS